MKNSLLALVALSAGLCCGAAPALALQTWQQLPMPTGVPADSVRDIAVSPTGQVLVSFDTQGVWRSSDHGQTWQSIQYNLPSTTVVGGSFGFNKQGDVLFTPNDVSSRGVYRLPVGGATWAAASIDWAALGNGHVPERLGTNAAGDVICVTNTQDVLRSTDGGASFSMITGSGAPLTGGTYSDLRVNPHNPNELAIGNQNGPEHLSTDGGLTWTDIGLPGGSARLTYSSAGQLFSSGTHGGIFTLGRWAGGTNWVQSDTGLPAGQDTRAAATSVSQMFVGNYDVFVSQDNGSTWATAGAGFPNMGTAQHLRALAVGDDGYLYAGVSQGATTKGLWRLLAYLPGDANQDGKVSFADYIVLANNFGQAGEWVSGDFNGDDKVSFADYILLANNFGQSVPEPATLSLMALGAFAMLRNKRHLTGR